MKTLILAAVAALFAVPAFAWEDLEDMSRHIDETNFIIGEGKGYCSGTLIDAERRLIVTAYHCVDGDIRVIEKDDDEDGEVKKKRVRITDKVVVQQRTYSGHTVTGSVSYMAEIVAHRKARDLAILRPLGDILNTRAATLLPVGSQVWRGTKVWAVGNPLGFDASVTSGEISSTVRSMKWLDRHEDTPMLQYSAGTSPGSSGGALYNTDGLYIATHVGGVPGETINIGIPVSELHRLLSDSDLVDYETTPSPHPEGAPMSAEQAARFRKSILLSEPDLKAIARQIAERMAE